MFGLCSVRCSRSDGVTELRTYLNEDNAPNPDDRETAERVITAIMMKDVISQGSFIIEGVLRGL